MQRKTSEKTSHVFRKKPGNRCIAKPSELTEMPLVARLTQESAVSRRDFIKTSATATVSLAALGLGKYAFAAGSDKLRAGLVGCGSRGTAAAWDIVNSAANVEIYALGDLFKEPLDECFKVLSEGRVKNASVRGSALGDKLNVTPDRCFVGFNAYKKVIACGVDIVLLVTPPHFRPEHLKAAVEAGKHVFMEKPVAVDPVGVRSIITSSELAERKDLAIVAGTHRRHWNHYIETIKRVHNGEIGEIVGGQCYFLIHNTPWLGRRVKKRQVGWSDMEWQCRCWYWFTWLSGDHIVEQHVHNLDVINWALGAHPANCVGLGGREVRKGPEYGNIFDHFAVEYEYPNGVRVSSMCRQTDGCSNRISERVVGTKGSAYTDRSTGFIKGQNAFRYDGPSSDPQLQEHTDLITSIRSGKPLNDGKRIAESTLTAIMGRMSAYTGRAMKWDWVMNASKLDLRPSKYEFGDLPVRPVAVPGITRLV